MSKNRTEVFHIDPPSANETVAKLRLTLRHRSLREREAEGIVHWERDEHVVRKGPSFDERYLELNTSRL